MDGINDTEEIVVKPLGKELKGLNAFAGATIMGDGRVALILDVLAIAQRSRVISTTRERSLAENAASGSKSIVDRQSLLLFGLNNGSRMALPLDMVARLEEIPFTSVERAAGHDVVQYRDALLPLIDVRRALGLEPCSARDGLLQVIVYAESNRYVGLVVDRIDDIVQEELTGHQRSRREGILASAIIQGRVTDILDVQGVIRRFDPDFMLAEAV